MSKQLFWLGFEKYFNYLGVGFLSLISGLFFLEVLYLLSGESSSFISYWLYQGSLSHAAAVLSGFLLAGVIGGVWVNSKNTLEFLSQETKSLQEMIQAKVDFISFVSHEIRSPATGILFSLQALLEEKPANLSSQQLSLLTKAYDASQDLNSLVSEFLDTSKIESKKLELVIKPVVLETLVKHIRNICSEYTPLLEDKKISLDVDETLDPTKVINADAQRLFQVVRNLLQNATNYTSAGGKIKITLVTSPTQFQFSIADSGIGIPKEEQDKIFEKFYRAVNAKITQSSGTGLGLYLCKKLVEGHRGKIWFVSEPDNGTTFFFAIPLRVGLEVEELFRRI